MKAKAKVKGRWHDNRHTLITDRAEGGAGDETIRDIAGHISKQVLKHYSHTGLLAQKCRRVYEFEIQWTYCRHPGQVNFNRPRRISNLRFRGYTPTDTDLDQNR